MSADRERGQSETIGLVLLISLILLGSAAVVALGSTAITNTQDSSEMSRAEQSMTLFDSQTAQVALGDSAVQTVDFGSNDGTMSVQPSAGEISIIQLDCDDNGIDDDGNNVAGGADGDDLTTDDDAYILEPTTLGSIVYDGGDEQIAYQGGGVWRKSKRGGSVMVSPPEFHYRGATLTLPLVMTRGSGGASGRATATIRKAGDHETVFPDSGTQFPERCEQDSVDEPFENPVNDGSAIVRIESEYARGWGRYFESRTEGIVSYYDTDGDGQQDDVVEVELVSLDQIGDFQMPGEGGSVPVSGAAGDHATDEFSIRLRPDDTDSANFDNLQWSMVAEEGSQQFELYLKKGSGSGCGSLTADLNIYYSPDGGNSYHAWHKDDAFTAQCDDLDGDGDDEIYMDLSFVDDGDDDGDLHETDGTDPELEYVDKNGIDNLLYHSISGSATNVDPVTLDGHGASWESKDYNANSDERETVDRLINHYFAELPEKFELTIDDKNSDTINEGASTGRLMTGGSGRYVTYLHVSKNEIEVEID